MSTYTPTTRELRLAAIETRCGEKMTDAGRWMHWGRHAHYQRRQETIAAALLTERAVNGFFGPRVQAAWRMDQ